MKIFCVLTLLSVTIGHASFAKPAMDIRLGKGWQAYARTGKTKLETKNVNKEFKEFLEEHTKKLNKRQLKENPIWETTSATASFYPHQPFPVSLSLRLASIPARRTILEQDSDKRFDLGLQVGNPDNGFYGGIYATIYEAFSYQLDDEETEMTIGDKTFKSEFSYELDSVRFEGEIGVRAPFYNRVYGVVSYNVGYYEIIRRTNYETSTSTKTVNEEGENIKKITSEDESWGRRTIYVTFTFAVGFGFVIGEKTNVRKPTPRSN